MKKIFKKMFEQMLPFFLALVFVSALASFSVSHPNVGKFSAAPPTEHSAAISVVPQNVQTNKVSNQPSHFSFDPIESLKGQLRTSGQ